MSLPLGKLILDMVVQVAGCDFNVFVITITLLLGFVFAVVAIHPSVQGSLLPAAIMSLYTIYQCYRCAYS